MRAGENRSALGKRWRRMRKVQNFQGVHSSRTLAAHAHGLRHVVQLQGHCSSACQAEKAPTKSLKERGFPHPDLAGKEALGPSALQEFLPQLPWGAEGEEGGTQLTQTYRLGPDLQNRGRGS